MLGAFENRENPRNSIIFGDFSQSRVDVWAI